MAEAFASIKPAHSPEMPGRRIYRHSVVVRLAHWINVLCVAILLMSGLQIFNAHPALYWGEDSDFDRPLFAIYATWTEQGRPMGITSIFGNAFETTGVLGRSAFNDRPAQRAFPAWITIPGGQDLATGRVWHFFFAWLFVVNGSLYLLYSLISRHFSRDLLPTQEQLTRLGETLRDHLRLRFRRGADAVRYNVVQKFAYLFVILLALPLVLLTGLTMSPAIDAAAPWLLDLFGGRQSARTIHFVVALLLVLFVFVHVVMVLLSGPLNAMRAMITGWYLAEHGERGR